MSHNYDYTRRLTSWHPGWLTVFGEDAPQGGGDKPTGGSMREAMSNEEAHRLVGRLLDARVEYDDCECEVPACEHFRPYAKAHGEIIARLASPAVSTEGGRSDSERMDWLEEFEWQHGFHMPVEERIAHPFWARLMFGSKVSNRVRDAIDAAMQSSVPNASEQSPPASPSEEGR